MHKSSTSILLENTSVAQIKSLYFASTYQCLFPQTEIALSLDCENASVLLNFTLRECPLGYTFNATINSMGTCQEANDQLAYDKDTGAVCVQNSNWYGQMSTSDTIISSCTDPYCASSNACPIIGFTDTHQMLPWTQDEQCKGLYGGLLCRSCKENCVFTFGASKCILSLDCKEEWQPYLIISLAVAGQIALALVLICSVGKSQSGVGYLYGPLFFLCCLQVVTAFSQLSSKHFTFGIHSFLVREHSPVGPGYTWKGIMVLLSYTQPNTELHLQILRAFDNVRCVAGNSAYCQD